MTCTAHHRRYLDIAARLAARGHGGAEPNPMVGCVIVDAEGTIVGEGYHRRCGGAHAERHALAQAGERAAGATAYVTLEPCSHHGRTGPCADALIEAKIARVVFVSPDPSVGAGGADRLRAAGIEVTVAEHAAAASASHPFRRRAETGLPWVIAKWAQTVDGRIATRAGASQWISGPTSRRLVHRQRGRVDAILTSAATVRADDPALTARGVRRRRIARRVVIDPRLETPPSAQLVRTASETPTLIACAEDAADSDAARELADAGVALLPSPGANGRLDLPALLRTLAAEHDVATILTECGAGLLGALFDADLVSEAWVFIGPALLGDTEARPAVTGRVAPALADGVSLELATARCRGGDVQLRYFVRP